MRTPFSHRLCEKEKLREGKAQKGNQQNCFNNCNVRVNDLGNIIKYQAMFDNNPS